MPYDSDDDDTEGFLGSLSGIAPGSIDWQNGGSGVMQNTVDRAGPTNPATLDRSGHVININQLTPQRQSFLRSFFASIVGNGGVMKTAPYSAGATPNKMMVQPNNPMSDFYDYELGEHDMHDVVDLQDGYSKVLV